MVEVKIAAVARTEFGKGAARRARRDGLVPPLAWPRIRPGARVAVKKYDTLLALRVANALLADQHRRQGRPAGPAQAGSATP